MWTELSMGIGTAIGIDVFTAFSGAFIMCIGAFGTRTDAFGTSIGPTNMGCWYSGCPTAKT